MSNGVSGLALLAQEQLNILLAEIAAALHDIGKFCDLHIEAGSSGGTRNWSNDHAYKAVVDDPASLIRLSPAVANIRKPDIVNNVLNAISPKIADFLPVQIKATLEQTQITVQGESYTLAELIMLSTPGFSTYQSRSQLLDGKNGWLPALLGICHHEAHHDKPELPRGIGQQQFPGVLASSVFGYEAPTFTIGHQQRSLDARLKALPISMAALNNPRTLIENTLAEFEHGLGDTRRPINEVTLATWASSVAALFKSALAGSFLDSRQRDIRGWQNWRNKIIDHDFQWRLLHISFDGLSFLERAPTISDLVGRQAALQAALDDVRELLEVTYPLGNEVYRDENGNAFVVSALDSDDAQGNRLRGLIESHILNTLRQSELGGELQPRIHITVADKQAAVLHKALDPNENPPPPVAPFQDSLSYWWQGEAADACTVCGVRPQGWGAPNNTQKRKAQARNICYVCLERRGRRAQIWARARHKTGHERKPWERTIWLDEVADENGRLALIVGKFDLSHWLNGDMIQTLLVVCDPANNNYESKNPSFARIQRVWRTTQQFWQNVQNEDIPAVARREQQRLAIAVTNADPLRQELGQYHVYDAEINGRRLSLVWDNESGHLLTADNLLAWTKGGMEALLSQLPPEIPLFEPGGYRQQRGELTRAKLDKTQSQVIPVAYAPTIDLLTQPTSFMSLVPATAALDAATQIAHRYELEMGKVCNRLPLLLGLIFFDRRQPLFGALDAGRRLLKQAFEQQTYIVASNQIYSRSDAPSYLDHPHFEQWREIQLKKQGKEILSWRVSAVMGDGSTPDEWYPYVYVQQDKDGNAPTGRKQFEYPQHSGRQWVHVQDVQNDDTICFSPSRFTWLHLDTSARRFEAGDRMQPLEELARITGLWQRLNVLSAANKLSDSQLQAIVTLLATKGDNWGRDSDEYSQLAQAILHKEGLDTLTMDDLMSGRLQETFELYHRIFKQKLKEEAA